MLISVYLLLRLLSFNIGDNAFFDQEIFKIARLVHVEKNVTATNKVSLDVYLRNCRPLGVLLDTFSEVGILDRPRRTRQRLTVACAISSSEAISRGPQPVR